MLSPFQESDLIVVKDILPSTESNLTVVQDILSTVAAIAAAVIAMISAVRCIFNALYKIYRWFRSEVILTIDEYDGLTKNEFYEAVDVYLSKHMIKP